MKMEEKSYTIISKPGVGRCIQAVRDIEPLEVILTDTPAVKGPHHDSVPVCLQCLRVHEGDYFCSDCNLPFCSEECSEEKEHKKECPILAKLAQSSQSLSNVMMSVMGLRLLLLKQDQPDVWQEIDQLIDHVEERSQSTEEWAMFQSLVVNPLKKVLSTDDDELIHRIIGIICVNSVGFDFKKKEIKGRALYPLLSLVSHDCVSNSRYTVSSGDCSVTLRARRKILEGEEITISYIPAIFGQPKRKRHIEEEWYFKCKCTRCVDSTEFGTYISALKCSHCREGLILPESTEGESLWRCRFCCNPFEEEFITNFVQNIEDELYDLSKSSPTIKKMEAFIKSHSGDLHTKHYLNLIAQRNLIHLMSQEPKTSRDIQRKIVRHSKNFITIMTRVDPGYSEWMGTILKKMNEAELAILKLDLQEKKVDKRQFAEKSEIIWSSMHEVENCEILCTPYRNH